MAAQELRWLTYLLTDLGEQPRSPPVLYVDNKAMLALCREHRLEHRTKHIALRYFLARELQQRGQLRLAYVASQANTADIFTNALPPGDHQRLCTMLGFIYVPTCFLVKSFLFLHNNSFNHRAAELELASFCHVMSRHYQDDDFYQIPSIRNRHQQPSIMLAIDGPASRVPSLPDVRQRQDAPDLPDPWRFMGPPRPPRSPHRHELRDDQEITFDNMIVKQCANLTAKNATSIPSLSPLRVHHLNFHLSAPQRALTES
ncbi:unnamed protein product [Closterium sp. NIES-54]